MAYATDRIVLFDRDMNPLREMGEGEVLSRVRTEEVNGEHSLVLTTTRQLQEGWRALTVDGTGRWREWCVTEIDEEHSSGKSAIGTYHLVWSLQYDLTNAYSHTHSEIGYGESPSSAQQVAALILDDVPRWTVGPCDAAPVEAGKGAVFIYESSWSKLSKAVEVMGCEVDAVIEVSNLYSVTSRQLCLKAHVGNEEALRRFDWGHDLTSVKRTPDPGPYYCRVVPLGKGETEYAEDDETTFEWPIDITEETGTEQNPGPYWIQDDEAAAAFRVLLPDGSYHYPTIAVSYSEDDPELLLNAAMEELHDYTRPGVTYEANVVQLAQAGMDVHGVALGDEVQVVDYGFNEDVGLRIQGRVTKMEVDELSPETSTQLTIGQLRDNMTDYINQLGATFDELSAQNTRIYQSLAEMTTARYIDELLARINAEINATGGYAYLVPGEGIITYDRAVSDPLVGSEAERVVQLKGGYLRIADSRKDPFSGIDDWDFKTILDSGHIVSDLITAVKITSGYIGNATNSNYWNLDTGEILLRLLYNSTSSNGVIRPMQLVASNADTTLAGDWKNFFITNVSGTVDRSIRGFKVATSSRSDSALGDSWIMIAPYNAPATPPAYANAILSNKDLRLMSNVEGTTVGGYVELTGERAAIYQNDTSSSGGMNSAPQTQVRLQGGVVYIGNHVKMYNATNTASDYDADHRTNVTNGLYMTGELYGYHTAHIEGYLNHSNAFVVNGTVRATDLYVNDVRVGGSKSRIVDTDNYSKRLLYCYETATPLFGDVGSGMLDDDGVCYVMIDDVFAETAHTDMSYQVFLQKCGDGDVWVSEKRQNYFVVKGTPNLSFDWEVKARQADLENYRLDSLAIREMEEQGTPAASDMSDEAASSYGDVGHEASDAADETASAYDDYISELEHIYDDELAA